jgi:hypothetical protein
MKISAFSFGVKLTKSCSISINCGQMKKNFRSFLFIPEGTEQANSPSNAILSLQKEALLVTCIVYSFCLKVVNRQLMEKEQEAAESQTTDSQASGKACRKVKK